MLLPIFVVSRTYFDATVCKLGFWLILGYTRCGGHTSSHENLSMSNFCIGTWSRKGSLRGHCQITTAKLAVLCIPSPFGEEGCWWQIDSIFLLQDDEYVACTLFFFFAVGFFFVLNFGSEAGDVYNDLFSWLRCLKDMDTLIFGRVRVIPFFL